MTSIATPADFADPTALNLGEFRGPGTLDIAAARALMAVTSIASDFNVTKVQFYFNGTPGVAQAGASVHDVLADWNTRRNSYQRAAGITATVSTTQP